MSKPADAFELMPGMKEWNEMAARMTPKQLAGSANLMAHPMAAFAASSAIGLGMASQLYGLWLGAVTGAMESVQRTASMPAASEAAYRPEGSAAARTRAAVDTLVEDARSTAQEVVGAVRKQAKVEPEPAARMAKKAAPSVKKTAEPSQSAALMPEDFVKPRALAKPAMPDDLKAIAGIGPKLEEVLNGLGIWNYDQIAAWGEAEIAWMDDYLAFSGRIARDGWIEQAARLGGRK